MKSWIRIKHEILGLVPLASGTGFTSKHEKTPASDAQLQFSAGQKQDISQQLDECDKV